MRPAGVPVSATQKRYAEKHRNQQLFLFHWMLLWGIFIEFTD
jgi:hypothetical protein